MKNMNQKEWDFEFVRTQYALNVKVNELRMRKWKKKKKENEKEVHLGFLEFFLGAEDE